MTAIQVMSVTIRLRIEADLIYTHGRAVFLAAALLPLLNGCAQTIRPPPPKVYAESGIDLASLAPELRGEAVEVLYLTDRKAEIGSDGRRRYGVERSSSLAYGAAVVRLSAGDGWDGLVSWTESHEEAPTGGLSTDFVSFEELGRFPETPYLYAVDENGLLEVTPEVRREIDRTSSSVREALAGRLARSEQKVVFLYVHGIRTSFEEVIVDLARSWHLTGRLGVPIAYSWPAGGSGLLSAYAYDRESGEFTIPHLKQVLRGLAANPDVEHVRVIAHSRGTDIVTSAIRELFIEARAAGIDERQEYKIEHLVLLAPDLDLEVAMQRLGEVGMGYGIGRSTVYVSGSDTAIGAAETLFRSNVRVGRLQREQLTERQLALLGVVGTVDFIEYFGSQAGGYGHGYFRNPAILSDIILLTTENRAPGATYGRPLEPLGEHFWGITDDYMH